MKYPRTLTNIAMAMALSGTTSAVAQEGPRQTPETAQAFLTRVVAAGGVQVTATEGRGYGTGHFFPAAGTYSYPLGTVHSSAIRPRQDGRPCWTEMVVSGKLGAKRPNNVGGQSSGMNPLWSFFSIDSGRVDSMSSDYEYATARGSGTIIWPQVSSVNVSGTSVTLPVTYAGGGVQFVFPTEDLAKRVGFAMEVIRLGCDPTSDPNF